MPQGSQRALSRPGQAVRASGEPGRRSHLVVLAACVSILAAALLLEPSGEGIKIGPWMLPSVCTFRRTTGVPCPGCGLTRSIVAAVHDGWTASYGYHRLGPLLVVYLLTQMVYRVVWLTLPSFRVAVGRVGRLVDKALIPLMVLLFLNWVPTLVQAVRTVVER